MALENLFKLQKLKITGYQKDGRIGKPQAPFIVMFNPTSLTVRHENVYANRRGLGSSGQRAIYSHSLSQVIQLDLVLDGTGVTDYGLSTLVGQGTKRVAEQIEHFRKLCLDMDGEIHEPKFLKIQWGEGALKDFRCRLQRVDIEYSAFDRNGAPLHATLKTTFVEDAQPVMKSSPDLSHTRVVKSGDTLPLLTKEIYGSAHYYLRVAQVNNLDDFRNLTPGQVIIFPPLEK